MEKRYNKPSEDFAGIKFGDKRLDKRMKRTVEGMEEERQGTILSSLGSRHEAKAFYSLLGNEKFTKEQVEREAYKGTTKRIESSGEKRILLVQDTCDINLNGHKKTEGLGYSSEHVRGVKIHSCLAEKVDGSPLGLIGQQYETRAVKKSKLSHEEKAKRKIAEKESNRWLETTRNTVERVPAGVESVVICDREGDFYELYAEMMSVGTLFVVRLTQDRVTIDGERSIQQLRRAKSCGEVEVAIPRDTRKNIPARTAKMEVAYCCTSIVRPKRVNSDLPPFLTVNLVRITEIGETTEPIEWLLETNLPLFNDKDAMEIVRYYEQR